MKSVLTAVILISLSAASALAQPPSADYPGQAPPPNVGTGYPGAQGSAGYGATPPSPAVRQARKAMRQACTADVQRLCANARTTGQRPMQCMRQHMSEVSPGCIQAFQALRAARQAGGGGPQG